VEPAPANPPPSPAPADADRPAPFLHAPERSRSIFMTTFAAACLPLAAGAVFFGWRALLVAALGVTSAMLTDMLFSRLAQAPSLVGRSHAALTGLLLGLTLPPIVPWYVPLAGGFLAVFVGKAIFGGVGHFLWQPALVGRVLVAVIFAPPVWPSNVFLLPNDTLPVLAPRHIIFGDVHNAAPAIPGRSWSRHDSNPPPEALAMTPPAMHLRNLAQALPEKTEWQEIPQPPATQSRPADADDFDQGDQSRPYSQLGPTEPSGPIIHTLRQLPPLRDLILGAYGGGIGETCVIAILVGGLYLVYRQYVKGVLPGMFLLAAAATAAIAPIRVGENQWQWLPAWTEGLQAGMVYVACQLAGGEIMLSAWFLATEMTSRPVTAPGQAMFGALCGCLAILLRMYTAAATPVYAAVLLANTLTPLLDGLRPRVLGLRRWWQFWKKKNS
jgi:Na+-translocating ferredoxin:NAD+ oxidoreductase RnfD subunit